MSKNRLFTTTPKNEMAFLVGIETFNKKSLLPIQDSLDELALLARTAGIEVVGQTTQKMEKQNPATLIGSGKVEEVKALANELQADIVLFDEELSPRHLRNLEEIFGDQVQILDRTALILDIFALHASTAEGKLQVELAQCEYRLPRLTRAWTHLARQAGGGGGRTGSVGGVGLRGPGETQLEVDKRQISHRMSFLKTEIEKVRLHRSQYRKMRKKMQIPIVALVGYTNAGKSTLLNQLTKSEVYVANLLFATLDPITRRLDLPGGEAILVTDTVGFIQKLPTQLIISFRATLEEINEADLLLHIVDISHPASFVHWRSVQDTLKEIGAENIPSITVLNKIDVLKNNTADLSNAWFSGLPNSIAISASEGTNIDQLINLIKNELFETLIPISVKLTYKQGQLISLFHQNGRVDKIEHGIGGVKMKGYIPGRLVNRFLPFIENKKR